MFERGCALMDIGRYGEAARESKSAQILELNYKGLPSLRTRAEAWRMMPSEKRHYEALQAPMDASRNEIGRAFQQILGDGKEHDESAVNTFRAAHEAYELLAD